MFRKKQSSQHCPHSTGTDNTIQEKGEDACGDTARACDKANQCQHQEDSETKVCPTTSS